MQPTLITDMFTGEIYAAIEFREFMIRHYLAGTRVGQVITHDDAQSRSIDRSETEMDRHAQART